MKHRTSAESAAAFLKMPRRGLQRLQRLIGARLGEPAPYVPDRRIVVDVATWTHAELVACVRYRIKGYEIAGEEVPHLTKIALQMLLDADRAQEVR